MQYQPGESNSTKQHGFLQSVYRSYLRRPENTGVLALFIGGALFTLGGVTRVQRELMSLTIVLDVLAGVAIVFGFVSIVLAMVVPPPK